MKDHQEGQQQHHHPLVTIHHLTTPVGSTQDEARRLLRSRRVDEQQCLAVTAREQLHGRGTQGRTWEGGNKEQKGNLYLTVCIPMDRIPVRITLLPLQVAVIVADRVSGLLSACRDSDNDNDDGVSSFPKSRVKWPNDVLVNDRKISGTLIENKIVDGVTWLLIGIGVNVAFTPSLQNSPGMHLRPATCIQDYCHALYDVNLPNTTAQALGTDIAHALVEWVFDDTLDKSDKEMKIIEDWKSFAEFGKEYQLRADDVKNEHSEGEHSYQGEKVVTVDIQYDGQLLVRGEDGRERLIVADYMF